MDVNIFRAIGDLAVASRRRDEKAHSDFLTFYRQLVETLPTEMVEIFGTLSDVRVRMRDGKETGYGIELTATDFMWWKGKIEEERVRFVNGPGHVQRSMLDRFAKNAEAGRLEPEDRKKLLALLDQATAHAA